MATENTSSEPTSGDFGDVDLAGLVEALDLTSDEKAHFSLNNEDETKPLEGAEVASEGDEVVEEEESQLEETVELETPEAGDGKSPKDGEEPKSDEEGKLSPAVQKRIDKLTAEKYAAKEEAEALKAQLTQAQQKLSQAPVQPAQAAPLSNVNSHADLVRARENALSVKEWALMNPDGGFYTTQGKDGQPEEVTVSAEQARELLVKANRMLDRDIPARQAYLNEAQGHFAEAKKVYPHLFDSKNPDAILAGQYLQQAPWLKNFPDWALVLGDTITGYRMRTAKAAESKVKSPTLTPNPAKAKVIGSPKGQAGPKVRSVKSPADLAKSGKNELSFNEASVLLDAFLN